MAKRPGVRHTNTGKCKQTHTLRMLVKIKNSWQKAEGYMHSLRIAHTHAAAMVEKSALSLKSNADFLSNFGKQ